MGESKNGWGMRTPLEAKKPQWQESWTAKKNLRGRGGGWCLLRQSFQIGWVIKDAVQRHCPPFCCQDPGLASCQKCVLRMVCRQGNAGPLVASNIQSKVTAACCDGHHAPGATRHEICPAPPSHENRLGQRAPPQADEPRFRGHPSRPTFAM